MRRSNLKPGSKSLQRGSTFSKPRTELARSSKRKRPSFTPASPAQRAKVRDAISIVSGEKPCDASHLTARAHGGCDDPLCVVPLTRLEHRAFDAGDLDILPYLIAHGFWAELAHAIQAHHVDPLSLIHRTTGVRWAPERTAA
jgi:hypothetical protein